MVWELTEGKDVSAVLALLEVVVDPSSRMVVWVRAVGDVCPELVLCG